MIKITHAPAGYFASLYRDGSTNASGYLDCYSGWFPTPEQAVAALERDVPRQERKLQKKIARLQERIREAQGELAAIASAGRERVIE